MIAKFHDEPGRAVDTIEMVVERIARALRPISAWTDYRGREGRRTFWRFALTVAAVVLIGRFMDWFVFGPGPGRVPLFFAGIAALVTIPPLIAAGVRRLRDVGYVGWLILLALVPVVGWAALALLWSRPRGASGLRNVGVPVRATEVHPRDGAGHDMGGGIEARST